MKMQKLLLEIEQQKIEDLKEQLTALNNERDELDISETNLADDEVYSEWLDELGDVDICGLTYRASYALREVDPIAYRCGFDDYLDGLDIEDSEEFQELTKKIEELETELDEKREELEEFINEINEG